MKVVFRSPSEEQIAETGMSFIEIYIDKKLMFRVADGNDEEDNTLSKNFSDCYNLDSLFWDIYKAGNRDEKFSIDYEEA